MTITYSFECSDDVLRETEKLKNYILKRNCKNLSVDISSLNFIDAMKVSAPVSAFHFAKYIDGSLKWLVKDEMAKNQMKQLMLKNMLIVVKKTEFQKSATA